MFVVVRFKSYDYLVVELKDLVTCSVLNKWKDFLKWYMIISFNFNWKSKLAHLFAIQYR